MSAEEKPKVEERPRRYLKDHKEPMRMGCYLQVRKMTFGELRAHFAERYPEVDFEELSIGGIQLQWEDEPTTEEREHRARQVRIYEEKQEVWERKTFERLKTKFEPASTPETTE